jgi:hypothetical protein
MHVMAVESLVIENRVAARALVERRKDGCESHFVCLSLNFSTDFSI